MESLKNISNEQKLLIVITTELTSLRLRLEDVDMSWEKERLENQIYVLNKILKDAGMEEIK